MLSYMAPGFPHSLFELIAGYLGAEVEFDETSSGPPDGDDPFLDGRADLGWICSTSFVDLALSGADPSIQLVGVAWVPDDPDASGRPVYYGDVTVATGVSATFLDHLRGARIGCNDPVSLSGHHALRIALSERGHDPDDFAELVFTGGHHRSLDLVTAGHLDAAVVDSVVRSVRAGADDEVAGLSVIERLGPWPVQPLVAAASMPSDTVAELRQRLLTASDDPALRRELTNAGLTRLVPIGPDHYESISSALAAL